MATSAGVAPRSIPISEIAPRTSPERANYVDGRVLDLGINGFLPITGEDRTLRCARCLEPLPPDDHGPFHSSCREKLKDILEARNGETSN